MSNEELKKGIKKISEPKELDELLTEIYKIKRGNSIGGGSGSGKIVK